MVNNSIMTPDYRLSTIDCKSRPVVRIGRIIEPDFARAYHQLHLHGIGAFMIEGFIIINAVRIYKLKCFQFALCIAPEKGNDPAFCLGRMHHPVEQVCGAITFNSKIDRSTVRHRSRLTGNIRILGEPETTMQHIELFSIQL
jgi:hypothetical protein